MGRNKRDPKAYEKILRKELKKADQIEPSDALDKILDAIRKDERVKEIDEAIEEMGDDR